MIPISKPYIGETEKQYVLDVLESGMLVQGEKVARLEESFTEVCQVKHAIAVSTGTAALHLALLAHGIGPSDEVITPSFTFIASVNSIVYTGATPVFADIEPDTFNLDPNLAEAAITPRTRAIMTVHLYGYPCNMDAFIDIARRHNLVIVEDAAQAIGAAFKGKPAGSFGTGCFSLYATKNIMTGEGGMVTTNDDDIARRLRMLRQHGMRQRYHHEILGYNFRMTDLHAAIGLAQMERLDDFTARRRHNAGYLSRHIQSLIVPSVKPEYDHVWHQYTVRVPDQATFTRDQAIETLSEAGIGTGVFYPVPAHQQRYVQERYGPKSLPVTEQLAQQVFSLPVHPQLSPADLERIAEVVNAL